MYLDTVPIDENRPVIEFCPLDMLANVRVFNQSSIVFYPPAQAHDAEFGIPEITYSHPSGTTFPFGTTEVKVTATDIMGNSAQCTFTVTVQG